MARGSYDTLSFMFARITAVCASAVLVVVMLVLLFVVVALAELVGPSSAIEDEPAKSVTLHVELAPASSGTRNVVVVVDLSSPLPRIKASEELYVVGNAKVPILGGGVPILENDSILDHEAPSRTVRTRFSSTSPS